MSKAAWCETNESSPHWGDLPETYWQLPLSPSPEFLFKPRWEVPF